MITTIQYETDEEKANILSTNSKKVLIEEKDITEGKFLIFSNVILDNEKVRILEESNIALKEQVNDLNIAMAALMGGDV